MKTSFTHLISQDFLSSIQLIATNIHCHFIHSFTWVTIIQLQVQKCHTHLDLYAYIKVIHVRGTRNNLTYIQKISFTEKLLKKVNRKQHKTIIYSTFVRQINNKFIAVVHQNVTIDSVKYKCTYDHETFFLKKNQSFRCLLI